MEGSNNKNYWKPTTLFDLIVREEEEEQVQEEGNKMKREERVNGEEYVEETDRE